MSDDWRAEAADELRWDSIEFHDPWCHCGWCIAHTVEKAALDTVVPWEGAYTTESSA